MNQSQVIIFVCEHGSAKSIVAAAYFNKLAREKGVNLQAVARGTNPDRELSPQAIKGLLEDGLTPTEVTPHKLKQADMRSAQQVITFCELPIKYQHRAIIEHWDNIPPVSENYEEARDTIIERIDRLIRQLSDMD